MTLSEFCIRRPVFATVVNIVIVLVGLVAWNRLTVREFPKVDVPTLTIETGYPGASPQIIENTVTKPLEDELSRIEGVDTITSQSGGEKSEITLKFRIGVPLDAAAMDAIYKISRIKPRLPNDVQESMLRKSDRDARPIMTLALTSESRSPAQLADYAEKRLQNEMETIFGVSRVEVVGGGQFVLNVWLDPNKLSGFKLTSSEVFFAIRRANLERPGGRIKSGNREYMVTTKALLDDPSKFDSIIVGERNGKFIRLSDVGKATFEPKNNTSRFKYNGKWGVAMSIYRSTEVSPVDVSKGVRKVVDRLLGVGELARRQIPEDIKLEVAYDNTKFIERAVDEVYETIFIAIGLVVLVVFAFVGSLRSSMIPLITIPISLIATFALLYAMGFSVNLLTLLALVLAVGLVVDDAIVVLENVYRYIEKGMKPVEAAIKGSKEIGFAIIAMTLTLAAVYAPIALAQGMTGRLFTEFALTLAGSVIVSGFTALTLSPMMCSRIMRKGMSLEEIVENPDNTLFNKFVMAPVGRFIAMIENGYNKLIEIAMKFKVVVLIIGVAFTSISVLVLMYRVPQEFTPKEDRGILIGEALSTDGATAEALEPVMDEVDKIADGIAYADGSIQSFTMPKLLVNVTLKPWEERTQSSEEIAKEINEKLKKVTGLDVVLSAPRSVPGASSGDTSALSFIIRSPKDMAEVIQKGIEIRANLTRNYGSKMDPLLYVPITLQEFTIRLKRDISSVVGLTAEDIATTFEIFTRGKKAGNYSAKDSTKLYDIMVGVPEEYRKSPDDLQSLYTRVNKQRSNQETLVPFSQLVEIVPIETTTSINHYNKMRSVTFQVKLKDMSMGDAIQTVQKLMANESDDFILDFTGEAKNLMEESQNMFFVFALAILFIYLVLSAQFESFIDPFIILLSVPLSIAGAAVTLYAVGGSMNIYSSIGMVTLIGLITKHGILIVDFANKAIIERGLSKVEAVVEACKLRLRPILMTTGAMVFGALPLAFASGAGAEVRFQIGWVIVGGMTIGTLFTLFVVPAVYTYLSRKKSSDENMPIVSEETVLT